MISDFLKYYSLLNKTGCYAHVINSFLHSRTWETTLLRAIISFTDKQTPLMNNTELWQSALGQIELSISKANFGTWFKNTTILSIDEKEHVVIGVPNGFAKEWLENKYHTYILDALRVFRPQVVGLSCAIYTPNTTKRTIDGAQVKKSQANCSSETKHSSGATPQSSQKNEVFSSTLNEKYLFSNYIVGENNELAKAACHAVCENLGKIYNPLFIYGGVGLGKTHLLQAMGNAVRQKDEAKRVYYISSEKFTNDLINSIKNHTIDDFKKTYQKIDLLIIDDVQFLSGKEKTQQEFFYIFNSLYQINKQIVISSDRPPKSIATLEERLRSRFEGGMIVDVIKPDLETRVAILHAKALEKNFALDEEVVRYIAENIKNNVRELEGALNRVMAICDLSQKKPSIEIAQSALGDIIASGRKRTVQTRDVIDVISTHYDVRNEELLSKGRKREVVKPRQIAMYLLRTELNLSYPGIGEHFGGRDHTTALHAYEKIARTIKDDERLRDEIEALREKIYDI